jgi:hypothetical protein
MKIKLPNKKELEYIILKRRSDEWEKAHEDLNKLEVPLRPSYPKDDLSWRTDFLRRELATERLMNGKTFVVEPVGDWSDRLDRFTRPQGNAATPQEKKED